MTRALGDSNLAPFVAQHLELSAQRGLASSHAKAACDAVIAEALRRGSNDNTSVVIICLNDRGWKGATSPPASHGHTPPAALLSPRNRSETMMSGVKRSGRVGRVGARSASGAVR